MEKSPTMSCQLVDKLSETHLICRENRVFIQTENSIGEDDVVGVKTTAHRLGRGAQRETTDIIDSSLSWKVSHQRFFFFFLPHITGSMVTSILKVKR